MINDKRMYFIRNIGVLKNRNVKTYTTEYEVIADACIIGELTYEPYYFMLWDFPADQRPGEEIKLCLRISDEAPEKGLKPWMSAPKNAYYHEGGIAEELVALASLFLRRRLKLGSIVRLNDTPTRLSMKHLTSSRTIDDQLIDGKSNLADLAKWLNLTEGLDSNYHQKFILAVRLYHQALILIEEQPDMAYLNLVSAIEVLCKNTDIGEVKLSDLDKTLSTVVGSVKDEGLRNKIEQAILKRERFHSRRFVSFILNHIEKDFWDNEKRPQHGKITSKELPDLLRRIYRQRSRTLHDGEPFPPTIFTHPWREAEIDFSRGIMVGGRKWEPKDFIPYPHFFERLVNHVLKTFLKKNQSS